MAEKKDDKKQKPGSRTVASNRKAFHEYHVLEQLTAGIVLTGSEIKSIRNGKASMDQSFARIEKGEVYLYGLNIAPYEQAGYVQHEPTRPRKLLLTRGEIQKLIGKTQELGLTLIPLKLFFSRAWVKVELGLCKGKKLYDKRATLKERESKREMDRASKTNLR